MTLREELLAMAEPGYRAFTMPLMPGVENVIGIRIPTLRKIAREIAHGDWRAFLAEAQDDYFEERMLQGLVVGYAKCTPEERLAQIARFVPKIDNWAVCDSFCMRKPPLAERKPLWKFIQPYFRSEQEYDVRFAVVTSLSTFVDEEHLNVLFAHYGAIRHKGYYARMAVAWAVSACFVKHPEQTLAWLRRGTLEDWTHNKAIQKICESYRVEASDKMAVRALKRR